MTDRKLFVSNQTKMQQPRPKEKVKTVTWKTTPPKRKLEFKKPSGNSLPPLFHQQQKTDSKANSKREDSLLIQIRRDLNKMVSIPTNSQSKTSDLTDFHGENATTTNRLFVNVKIKASLERILYLWSVRIKDESPTPYCSRYVPGMVDIVCPLYVSFLQGSLLWDTHISSTKDAPSNGKEHDDSPFISRLRQFSMNEYEEFPEIHNVDSNVLEDEERREKIKKWDDLSKGIEVDMIPDEILEEIEADTYWCIENFMNAIQDYRYNFAFVTKRNIDIVGKDTEGLQRMIILMEKVLERTDPSLHVHLKSKGVEYQWFAFQWMNTLLVRELNEKCILRLWDTCMCEEDFRDNGSNYFSTFGFNPKRAKKKLHLSGFLSFQVYLCAALLHQVRDVLLSKNNFEEILYHLRNLSIKTWDIEDVSLLLSQAFAWKETFRGSEKQMLLTVDHRCGDEVLTTWVKKCHWPPRKSSSRPTDSIQKLTTIMHNAEGKILQL